MRGIRILVVDDNVDAAGTLRVAFEMAGYSVAVAHTAEAALPLLGSHLPHLAFLDLGMPELDGFVLARLIRSFGRPIYLTAVSGFASRAHVAKAFESGFNEHLAKPASIDDVLRIARFVEREVSEVFCG